VHVLPAMSISLSNALPVTASAGAWPKALRPLMTFIRNHRLVTTAALCLMGLVLCTGCIGTSKGKSGGSGGTDPGQPAQTYSLSGTITPAAQAAGVTVKLSGAGSGTATADNSGNFTFASLAAGTYTVTPSKAGFAFSPSKLDAIVSDANVTGLSFELSPAKTWHISGSISPAANGSGATVTLSGASDAVTTADGSGNYAFDGVADGSYTVTPSRGGFAYSPYSLNASVSGADVNGLDFSGQAGCSSGHGGADFYVSPQGNDSWSGKLDCPNQANTDGPFASIAKAQQAVQAILPGRTSPVIVMVRDGVYYLPTSSTNPGTLNFTAADSGTSSIQITWQNYPDETPVISGGVPVSGWTNVSGNLWQVNLSPNMLPFEYLYYNGERRLRSRLQSSGGVGYYMNGGSCISSVLATTVDNSFCTLGSMLRIAAEVPPTGANATCPYTTNADGSQSKCMDRFQYDPNDPITSWINLTPSSGNACGQPSTGAYPVGEIELTMFDAWTADVMRVSCVDTTKHILYLTGATNGSAPSQYGLFGPVADHRYVVENTLDGFNAERAMGLTGIWFVDRSTFPWTLSYLAKSGENPNTDTVVIPQLGGQIPGSPATDYFGASLLMASDINYVTFSGFTFEADNFTPAYTGFNNDTNSEYTAPQAIDCERCQNVTFDGITVRHTSGSAILLAGSGGKAGAPSANDVIQNSAFYDLGSSGIRIGRTPSGGDHPQYVPHNITVQNNIIQGYSRVFPDGEGIAMGNGHDVNYAHNDINDGYHAGISICSLGCASYQWSANGVNIVTQYNHIWNVMGGITSDGGALYYDTGAQGGSGTGNQILNNLIHDVNDASVIDWQQTNGGYGGHGIYLDIRSSGINIENNIVYRVSGSGLVMTDAPYEGGAANTFNNNIIAYSRRSMFQEQNPWPQNCTTNLRASLANNIFYFDQDDTSGFYAIAGCTDSCSMSYNKYQSYKSNLYWRTDGGFASYDKAFHLLTNPPPKNQASMCSQVQNPQFTFLSFSQWQNSNPQINGAPLSVQEDAGGTASVDPGFGKTGDPSDFLLLSQPMAGFNYNETNNTVNLAGRVNPVIQPPVVPQTFPTYAYPVSMF